VDTYRVGGKWSYKVFISSFSLFLAFTTGDLVRAKPSKIVSGQEAERTNEFLQILSIAILKQVQDMCTGCGMSVGMYG